MLKNIWLYRLLMVALWVCILMALDAPSWATFAFSMIFAYLAFPESRSFHIATSKIVQYSIGYNLPKHGNPGDLFHKVDEEAVYKMDARGEWVRR
jgi:cephalosporin-C deacetylase-like acetyl esterase